MVFVAATNNKRKYAEIRRILEPLGFEIITLEQAGVSVDPEETARTFEGNARIKAAAALKVCGQPCIADDSGLVVDALGGRPGVYSARYAGEGATDEQKISKLLGELENVAEDKRTARFVCCACCAMPDGAFIEARGVCEGSIAREPAGNGGFGYDPVFIEKTTATLFSQLSGENKDALSHRGSAFAALAQKLAAYCGAEI